MDIYRPWLARTYVNAMNILHYMHDKYAYEKTQMALHDTDVHRCMEFVVSGMSVLADSLSAIKYSKVRAVRDESGLITDFETAGEYPAFGNDEEEKICRAAAVSRGFRNLEKFELLPFRKLCASKYEAMGICFPLQEYEECSQEEIDRLEKTAEAVLRD